MRKAFLFLPILCLQLVPADAQVQINTGTDLDINNIRITHLVHGDMWWRPDSVQLSCEFPKGSGNKFSSGGSLWIGGYDPQNLLHVAAQSYRQNGNDYWPGPVDTSVSQLLRIQHAVLWGRIWKINRSQVDSFLAQTSHTVANTPAAILEWPATGNPYAMGNGGPLTINEPMAPFVDINNDGQYNPLNGDYPAMKGDQMLWWIINDQTFYHANSGGLPLGFEIRHTAYAYKRNTIADNIIFYEFSLKNKSSVAYHGLRFGFASDFDMGYAFDDYAGFDSSRRMGLYYNATPTTTAVAGITMLELPGDYGSSYVPAGSFMYWKNDFSVVGNPGIDTEFNYLLRATNRGGNPLPNSARYALGKTTECDSNVLPADQRMVIATEDMALASGASVKIAMALVMAPAGGGCPNLDFTGIEHTADTAWYLYRNAPAPAGVGEVAARKTLRIYPNPVQDYLTIETGDDGNGQVSVYDAVGRALSLPVNRSNQKLELQTASLVKGVYTILYLGRDGVKTNIFVKE